MSIQLKKPRRKQISQRLLAAAFQPTGAEFESNDFIQ
jgi:hypothetical protein